jgi:hypothetical protein
MPKNLFEEKGFNMTTMMNPSPIIEMATAYWQSATLLAGVRLNVFDHLAKSAQNIKDLSEKLQTTEVAVDTLMTGLRSLGLVEKNGDVYQNSPLSQAFLVPGQPQFIGTALLYNADVYPLWGQLSEVILKGDVTKAPELYLGEDEGKTRRFVQGMHDRALGVGRAVAQVIDFSQSSYLADFGGGPGTYSALLTQKHPNLKADVLDLPAVVKVASEIVEKMGSKERVTCLAFDYYQDLLSKHKYDAVLISGVLHREQPAQVQAIFKDVADALPVGGVLYISDVMLNDDRSGPIFSAMFALNMRILSHDGRCHSVQEQREWLSAVGLEVEAVHQLPAPINYTVIRAIKK